MAVALHTPIQGLTDPVFDAQSIFRLVLNALARPGRIARLSMDIDTPPGLMPAAAGICLCLADVDTPVWLDSSLCTPEVDAFLRFHTGCGITGDPRLATFAIAASIPHAADIARFRTGTAEYPDQSTTLIVQVNGLDDSQGVRLSGPGIEKEHLIEVADADSRFWEAVVMNNAQFPLGVDFLLVEGDRLVGLPRSVCVKV